MDAFGHKADKSKVNIGEMLTANNAEFYFDYQNGKYGFNTDPNRGASTFYPFKTEHTETKTITNVGITDMGEDHAYRYIQTDGLMVIPTATKAITANGNNIDVLNYAKVNVSVADSYKNFSLLRSNTGTNSISISSAKLVYIHYSTNAQKGAVFFVNTGMLISGKNVGQLSGGSIRIKDDGDWGYIQVSISGSTLTFTQYNSSSQQMTDYSFCWISCFY